MEREIRGVIYLFTMDVKLSSLKIMIVFCQAHNSIHRRYTEKYIVHLYFNQIAV